MGDAINGAAREVWEIIVRGVTDPGPWSVALMAVFGVVGVGLILRGKLASWMLIPVLVVLGYWGWQQFS